MIEIWQEAFLDTYWGVGEKNGLNVIILELSLVQDTQTKCFWSSLSPSSVNKMRSKLAKIL